MPTEQPFVERPGVVEIRSIEEENKEKLESDFSMNTEEPINNKFE